MSPSEPVRPDELPYEGAPPEILVAMGKDRRPPTVQQWSAISHDLTPCAVVAGAGSGKTAVMAARVVYLTLNKMARPSEILCLTFTNKAAEELANRVREATSPLGLPEGEEATVMTYHAFAARLLDDYGLRMGVEAGPMLLTAAHKWQLASTLFTDRTFDHLEVRTVAYTVRLMLQLADHCANHLVDPLRLADASEEWAGRQEIKKAWDRDARECGFRRAELARLVDAYSKRKAELGVIDYGDQIAKAVELIRNYPAVVADFRARYPVVLLDEYQDTNYAQAVLISELFGAGYPMMCVGDPDQNIYAWRGASLRNILRFADEFTGDSRPLYVNFRSGSRILEVANRVISEVPEERRAKDKQLRPHPSRGEGRVVAFVGLDERHEGRKIAGIIKEERAAGRSYGEIAVLCRKKRLFGPIAEVLREEGIPVEVVDLGGLLQLPEVVDVVSWLRLLEDPGRNIALARVLQGPQWRIGYRDLVALARWSARRNRLLKEDLKEAEHPGDVAFALAEALDNLEDPEMEGFSDEARTRLREFNALFESLRSAAAGGPLDELVTVVIERTGLMRELEASSSPVAVGARRNLLNFVGSVSSFAPVEGDATLSTLMSYLDAAGEAEEDFEQVQLSDAETVKLLTIHKAKGLEWDVVFVPGLAEGNRSAIFPDVSRQPNPVTRPETLPFDFRGDREVLPQYDGNIKKFRETLKERGLEEERRLCYVALTRARQLLVCSAAYWYEGPQDPFEPSVFFNEIVSHEACEELEPRPECPEHNPLIEVRAERAKVWPPEARPDDAGGPFPEGWHAAAVAAMDEPVASGTLSADERALFDERLGSHLERIELISTRATTDPRPSPPTTLSVSALLEYERCPKLFYWEYVRPLPRRPSGAARIGTEIHRWIEQQSQGQVALFDPSDQPDLAPEERGEEPGTVARLREAWSASRFAGVTPWATERPFLLAVDGFVIGGRIDAIFGERDGAWEIVDYKTGRVPAEGDPVAGLQLDVYALAAHEVWGKKPEDLTLTYYYVSEGKEVSRAAGDMDAIRARILSSFRAIAESKYEPEPSAACHWCAFLPFCDAGQAFVNEKRH
jgi:DNA helicase II / ATP-dependent DNA helicase PcrA